MASKKLLMVAYHFPPLAGSSGIQRTLRLVQQLPSHGWEPIVLTIAPRAYERTCDDLSVDVPVGTVVHRAAGLDAARHLAIRGRYIAATARPDRWISWRFFGIRDGMRLIDELRPNAIWSTYPIATAHVIGAELSRRSGLPWVADFRDPMAQSEFPADPVTRARLHALEARTLRDATLVTVTTPSAARECRERHPGQAQVELLENGYDEATFAEVERDPSPLNPGCITLLHSGIVYPSERDPTQLFEAMARLHRQGRIRPGVVRLRFRAPFHDAFLLELAARMQIEPFVEVLPPLPYKAALAEMMRADALLVLQASNCNAQIPAKVYEYLRARRPVLGLCDPAGDTWAVLAQAGIDSLVRLDSADAIAAALPDYLAALATGGARTAPESAVRDASRASRTALLAKWLDECLARTPRRARSMP